MSHSRLNETKKNKIKTIKKHNLNLLHIFKYIHITYFTHRIIFLNNNYNKIYKYIYNSTN